MLSVNKIINGAGAAVGWAVIEDKARVLKEFDKVEAACAWAKKREEEDAAYQSYMDDMDAKYEEGVNANYAARGQANLY